MKKLFTLLMLMLFTIGTAWAADYTVTATRTISADGKTSTWSAIAANGGTAFQNGMTALGEGMYFVADGKCQLNGGQINVKANALMYLEVPSTTSAGSVTINDGNATDRYFETPSGGKLYMKGSNTIDFTSEDIEEVDGVNYLKLISKSDNKFKGVSITLTSTDKYVQLVKLKTPIITVNSSNGEVSISGDEHATKITYTTDGSDPSASSDTYEGTFTAEDGQTIKAVAIGDGESYDNSAIASQLVMLDNATIATPVISQFNGSVAITCETAGTTIEYSLDGENYTTYTRAFTLTDDGTVSARAKRGDKVSEVASASVTTISKGEATKTIYLSYGAFTISGDKMTLTGAEGNPAEGFTITMDQTGGDKTFSNGSKITTPNGDLTTIKGSNGRQVRIEIPSSVTATRLTLYSYQNAGGYVSGWKEVDGQETEYTTIPMGAYEADAKTPDVRVYQLDNLSGTTLTFNNGGAQLCWVAALDVIESQEPTIKATSEIALKAVPYNKTSTATITLTGSNLTDGTYDVTLPSVAGLSIEPTSFTVDGGAVEQTFTVTYTSETDVESATANIVFSVGTTSAETVVTYESRASLYELAEVSEATTWDWSAFNNSISITLTDDTTPSKSDEYVMKELEGQLTFGDFPAESIALKGERPVNKQAFQNGLLKIKTTVPGTIKVDFSDTGSSGDNPAKRYLVVNGLTTAYYTQRTGTSSDKKTGCEVAVPAGEITITGTQAIMIYKLTFTPADAPTITATITDAGYATFSSLFEVAIPDGVEAYYASASEGSTVTMTSIDGGVIPAGTGVVLKGNEGSYTMTVSNTGATLNGTNLLKANIADREPGETEYYTLAAGPKFSKSTGGVLAAGKAYLVISGASARTMTMKFDGETTGISELKSVAEEGALYNLSGARVSKPTKGLYIQNGKKLMVK